MSKIDFSNYLSNQFSVLKSKQLHKEIKSLTRKFVNTKKDLNKVVCPNKLESFNFKLSNLFFSIYYDDFEIVNTVIGQLYHLKNDIKEDLNPKNFYVFKVKDKYFLNDDKVNLGSWKIDEIHFLTGKLLSMIMCEFHSIPEENWSAFLHASSVSKNDSGFIIVGESGNGKSTSSAILSKNGFNLTSDDITPICRDGRVGSFPNLISVKTGAYTKLKSIFSKNMFTKSFDLSKGKIRFLNPVLNQEHYPQKFDCKNLIWVQYQEGEKNSTINISKKEILSLIVNDSFFPMNLKSIQGFMAWFSKCHCYKVTYSQDEYLINFFNDIA